MFLVLHIKRMKWKTRHRKEEWNIRCAFDQKEGHKLGQLTTGQTVTVQGNYDGYKKNILLRDCVLVH